MRRLIGLLIVIFAGGSIFQVSQTMPKPATPVQKSSSDEAPSPQPDVKPLKPSIEETLKTASQKTESLTKMYGNYLGGSEAELKREVEKSKSVLAVSGLLEKDDLQSLNEEEAIFVLTEIRKQHVLLNLLAKKKLENLRRTYL